jgi:hypothetical protein
MAEPLDSGRTAAGGAARPGGLRDLRSVLLVAALYVAAVVAVDPRGEFPLNDDWSYTRSAFGLAAGRGLRIDPWSAPSLAGQALYGGALARLFGPSFTVLRLSTIALGAGLALALWSLLRRLGAPPGFCLVAVLGWTFGPILFSLTFTFMTEVPFLFCMALALLALERHLATDRTRPLLLCAFALGYGYLIRQTSVLYAAAALAALVVVRAPREGPAARARRALALLAVFGPFVAGYQLWLATHGGPTPAVRRKFELLGRIGAEQLAGNTLAILFYAAFALLPAIAYLAPLAARLWQSSQPWLRRAALAGWSLVALGGVAWFGNRYGAGPYLPSQAFHGRMPYVLNVLYDTGLGPVTLEPTYYGPPPTPTYPRAWTFVTAATALGVVLLGLLATCAGAALARFDLEAKVNRARAGMLLAGTVAFGLTAGFETVFSHLEEGGLFDRHVLAAVLPLLPALAAAAGAFEAPRSSGASRTAAVMVLLGGLLAVTGTHDYLAWNRARWELGRALLARGVDPLTVAGGFEFNAWHNYDTFRARGGIETVYTWWRDSQAFLITLEPEPGYRVRERREYRSWVHRRSLPVYLLERIP